MLSVTQTDWTPANISEAARKAACPTYSPYGFEEPLHLFRHRLR